MDIDTNDFGEIVVAFESLIDEININIIDIKNRIDIFYGNIIKARELHEKLKQLASDRIDDRIIERLDFDLSPLEELIAEFKKGSEQKSHNVYVIRLEPEVLSERKYAEENPHHRLPKPCVYVGETWHDPDHRFAQHQEGGMLSNNYVFRYGIELMREEYEFLNPMTKLQAKLMEPMLAKYLRGKGYAAYQR